MSTALGPEASRPAPRPSPARERSPLRKSGPAAPVARFIATRSETALVSVTPPRRNGITVAVAPRKTGLPAEPFAAADRQNINLYASPEINLDTCFSRLYR